MFGSHLSIAGGMHKALLEAETLGLDSVQVFTGGQKVWATKPLEASVIDRWRGERERLGFGKVISHDSYLINLASPDEVQREKSRTRFAEEVRRCDTLGIEYLVTHPGAHVGSGESAGIATYVEHLDRVLDTLPDSRTTVCLESTAGQGTCLGHRLEHLAEMIDTSAHADRLGVCLDTAHLFAAGYDLRGSAFPAFWKQVQTTIGEDRIKVLHLNDSKKPLGSRVDRHEHIGLGTIGDDGFRPLLKKRCLKRVPKILETPKGKTDDGTPWDTVNVTRLKSL